MSPDQLEEFKKFTEQAIKDTAVHVKNNTEKTNSGLVADLWSKIETKLEPAMDKLVNGKINNLTKMQEQQNIVLESIQIQVQKLIDDTKPIIEKSVESNIFHKYVGKFGSSIIKVGAVFSAISFIVLAILGMIRYIK